MPEQRFAVYASSVGNYFFDEIRRLFACGLRESGFRAVEKDDRSGFVSGVDWHLIVAPHEFFQLGAGAKLRDGNWPRNIILYNTEQPNSQWFQHARRLFPKARAIWDLDFNNARQLAEAGWPCDHLPLGWAPSCEWFRPVRRLPNRAGLRSLPREARRHPGSAYFCRRPLDILFVGALTPRRNRFFTEAGPHLSKYRTFLQFPDNAQPIRTHSRSPLDGETLFGLAQRSRIVLNIHRDQARYFEWHRIALHGIGQGALVVSEPVTPGPPFEAGKDFIEAPLSEIPGIVRHLLVSSRGQEEAARIAAHGLTTYRERCRLSDLLPPLVERLGRPRPKAAELNDAPRIQIRASPVEVVWKSRKSGTIPKVTVAVSLYNYKSFIRECLDSTAAQTLRKLDLIVIDDASNDGSLETARRWMKHRGARFSSARLLRHNRNLGLSFARNTAFERARTESVFVLDADNAIFPECLDRMLTALAASSASFAYSYLRKFGESDGLMNTRSWSAEEFKNGNYIDAMALVRRSVWKRLGGYRVTHPPGWEDFDFWLKLARSGGWGLLVPEILGSYRVHLTSMLHTKTNPDAAKLYDLFRDRFDIDLSAGNGSFQNSNGHYENVAASLFRQLRERSLPRLANNWRATRSGSASRR